MASEYLTGNRMVNQTRLSRFQMVKTSQTALYGFQTFPVIFECPIFGRLLYNEDPNNGRPKNKTSTCAVFQAGTAVQKQYISIKTSFWAGKKR
jgi:hypothetical protein